MTNGKDRVAVMRRIIISWLAIAVSVLLGAAGAAAQGLSVETTFIEARIDGKPFQLQVQIVKRPDLEGKLPIGIQIANKLREGSKKIPDYLEFESELTLRPPAEVAEMGLATLTGLDTPVAGALEQNIFYVNQVMQFGKLLAVFQGHPTDAKQTVVTVFMALAVESNVLAKKKEFMKVPVLRNLVPAQVLAGKSSFNSGSSISAGLPVYARNQVKAIAAILERK